MGSQRIQLPPGPLLLLRILRRVALPLGSVYVVHHTLSPALPTPIWIALYVLVIPAIVTVLVLAKQARIRRDMGRVGARPAPVAQMKLPGGVDFIKASLASYDKGYLGDLLESLENTYGHTYNVRVLWTDTIVTTEPQHLKRILATEFDNFDKGLDFNFNMKSVLGVGVFNADGDLWKFHRNMTRPYFTRDRISDFDIFDRHSETALARIKSRVSEGESIDFQDVMGRFTLDSASEFLFGSCVHSLSAELPYAHNSSKRATVASESHMSDTFVKSFGEAQHILARRFRWGGVWPFAEFSEDQTKPHMRIIDEYLEPILSSALEKKKERAALSKSVALESDYEGQTLLDHLVDQTDDPVILHDETLNILIAGRDTTMSTLTFVVYCLAQHPEVLARLREEVLTKLGPTRKPTFDDVRECKYLRAVINETLRLYPPVPFNQRHSKASTTFPAPDGGKPFYIPANVDIAYSVWFMHRRPDLWGPDAHLFDPDRFLDHRVHKYLTPNPFIFLPFNAGPRICLGQQFAYNEASFMLFRLMQSFEHIELALDAQPPDSRPPAGWKEMPGRQGLEKLVPKAHLTLYSHKGLWVRLKHAQHDTETA